MSEHTLGTEISKAIIDNGSFGTREITFSTGRLARQAAGSALAQLGDTVVLSATTVSKHPKDNLDFFPLTVDIEERMYAVGRIPGSFFRREGRPSEDAILTCRLIDRPLRPSFAKGLRNEIQIVGTVLALDPSHPYDVVAINAASMSTKLAGLPFSGPVGATRVAHIDGQWVAFPTNDELTRATFDMVVAGRALPDGDVAIMMVEAEATEHTVNLIAGGAPAPTEEVVASGLEAAKPAIRELCRAQQVLADSAAKPTGEFPVFLDYQDDVYSAVESSVRSELADALKIAAKQERESELDRLKDAAHERLDGQFEGREKEISAAFRSVHALPLRLRGEAIGALNLFHRHPGPLPPLDLSLGQALADVATIGILSERAVRHGEILNEQLQTALHSRVIIEQAKGVLTQKGNLSMDSAFDRLRSYARNHNLRLSEVARQVVETDIADDVVATQVARTRQRR